MSTPSLFRRSRLTRAASRGFAALALVLSMAAPLHGLLHDQADVAAAASLEAPGHAHAHAQSDAGCLLCTLAGSKALLNADATIARSDTQLEFVAPRAVLLASRQGAAAPARGPPAPTC